MAAHTPKATLKDAARARFCEGLPWNVCAQEAAISARTLRAIRERRDPKWLEVCAEITQQLEDEALPAAFGCLIRMASRNDVNAAKALLERYRAAKVEVGGDFHVWTFDSDGDGDGDGDGDDSKTEA